MKFQYAVINSVLFLKKMLPFTWDSNDFTYTAGKFISLMSHHWNQENGHW